jgi:hypothetical protein
VFFLASLFVFIKAHDVDQCGYSTDKVRALLLYCCSKTRKYSDGSETSSSNKSNMNTATQIEVIHPDTFLSSKIEYQLHILSWSPLKMLSMKQQQSI